MGGLLPESKFAAKAAEQVRTFGKLADMWLQSVGTLSAATKDQYATAVRMWKKLFGEGTPLDKLDHQLVAAKIGGYKWPSAKTRNNYLIALRGVFGLEYSGRRTLDNPMIDIENERVVKSCRTRSRRPSAIGSLPT